VSRTLLPLAALEYERDQTAAYTGIDILYDFEREIDEGEE
jgi:hypothetical protein